MATRRIPSQYATLALAQAAAVSGDTIEIESGYYLSDCLGAAAANLWSSTGKVVHFTTSGAGKAYISGAVGTTGASWTNTDPGIFTGNIGASAPITAVTLYYRNFIITNKPTAPCIGAAQGWLTEVNTGDFVADTATVEATDQTWAYDTTTGNIIVNTGDNSLTSVEDNDLEWCRGIGNNAITVSTGNGSTFNNLAFDRIDARYVDTANGAGIIVNASTGCTVTDCDFRDCRDKALGFTGTVNTGHTVSGCRFWGCTAQNPDSQLNFFTTSGNISGITVEDCEFYVCGLYTPNWFGILPPRPSVISGWGSGYGASSLPGISTHVMAVGTQFVSDVEVTDCSFEVDVQFFFGTATVTYPGRGIMEYVIGTASLTGSEWLVDSYPVRFVRCSMTYGMGTIWQTAAYVAYDRCNLLHNGNVENATYATAGGGASKAVFAFGSNSKNAGVLISGTYLASSNKATSTNLYSVVGFGNQSTTPMEANLFIRGVKSAIIDLSVCNALQSVSMFAPYPITYFSSNQGVNAMAHFDSCLIAKVSGATLGDMQVYARCLLIYGDVLSGADEHNGIAGQFTFNNCIGYGWLETATANGGYSTTVQASWCSTSGFTSQNPAACISRNFRYGTSTMLASPATSSEPASSSAGDALRLQGTTSPFASIVGVNGRGGTNAGQYQYGSIQDTATVQFTTALITKRK